MLKNTLRFLQQHQATFNCTLWSCAPAVNILRVTVNCFPFEVIVFAMLPAHGIWQETVSLLDVMWPWASQWNASYITSSLPNFVCFMYSITDISVNSLCAQVMNKFFVIFMDFQLSFEFCFLTALRRKQQLKKYEQREQDFLVLCSQHATNMKVFVLWVENKLGKC